MCGIAGILNLKDNTSNPENVQAMLSVMKHRGPDNEGIWTDNSISLGHRRLSIIDLSPEANQPMLSSDGKFALVYNGEIYNFRELRAKLEKLGSIFRTESDTEVVLEGYRHWGAVEFAREAEGMWAFGLWDIENKTLWLSRDRIGQKPLYFAKDDETFSFASTLTALRQIMSNPVIDFKSMHQFIGCSFVPPYRCIYLGVEKVPPATCIRLSSNGLTSWQYWKVDFSIEHDMSEGEALKETQELLNRAVERCMIADVPLGFNLSGGVDSSLVTALASEKGYRPKTFTMCLPNSPMDETIFAQTIASKLMTDHHRIPLQIDAMKLLPKLAYFHGEPFGDSSAIPSYFVAREVSRNVTVCITGDGGDEVFAGYPYVHVGRKLDGILRYIPRASTPFLSLLGGSLSFMPGVQLVSRKIKSMATLIQGGIRGYFIRRYSIPNEERHLLYKNTLLEDFIHDDSSDIADWILGQGKCRNAVSAILFGDLIFNLPGDYCVKVDCANMANSVESRSPFMENYVVDFASSIPTNILLKGGEEKHLIKRLAAHRLPRHCIYRKKQGFSIPLDTWLSSSDSNYLLELVLEGRLVRDRFLNPYGVRECATRFLTGQSNNRLMWNLLCLEYWYRNFHLKEDYNLTYSTLNNQVQ